MPITITVESGTGTDAAANSYATVEQLTAYCEQRNLVLPADAEVVKALLVQAADFVDTLAFKGERTSPSQPMQWPREGVYLYSDDEPLADTAIPSQLIKGQCQLAYDASLTDLMPTGDGKEVLSEKVDVLEIKYAERGSGSVLPQFNKAMSILAPLLESEGGFTIQTERA